MPWVRFTDDWYDDEDMASASPLALAMWAVAITWSARNLTDGRIPKSQVRKLLDLEDITLDGAKCRADDIAAELVGLGKWAANGRGYLVHNYHRYQPTREQVIAQREANAERQRRFKAKEGNASGNGVSNGPSRLPSPVDKTLISSSGNSQGTSPPVDNPDDDGFFAAVWDHYAQLMYAKQPANSVEKPHPWKRKTAENAMTEHSDTATRWHAEYDVTPQHLAQCLVDGKAPASHYRRKDPA